MLYDEDGGREDEPTTMTVNWTPFLTLLPLRLPANDILTSFANEKLKAEGME